LRIWIAALSGSSVCAIGQSCSSQSSAHATVNGSASSEAAPATQA
jgi:hypothetical protein